MKYVYDRTEQDLHNNTAKAYINASDLNRIEGNMELLLNKIDPSTYIVNTDWQEDDLPTKADSKRIIGNLNAIAEYVQNNSDYIPPELPATLDKATIHTFNTIERELYRMFRKLPFDYSATLDMYDFAATKIIISPSAVNGINSTATVNMREAVGDIYVREYIDDNDNTEMELASWVIDNISYDFNIRAKQDNGYLWFVYDYTTNRGYFDFTSSDAEVVDGYYADNKWWFTVGFCEIHLSQNEGTYIIDLDVTPYDWDIVPYDPDYAYIQRKAYYTGIIKGEM